MINAKAPGSRAKLNDAQRQALAKIVESGPIPAVHGVVRWRRKDLVQWLFQEFRVSVDETTGGPWMMLAAFESPVSRSPCPLLRTTRPVTDIDRWMASACAKRMSVLLSEREKMKDGEVARSNQGGIAAQENRQRPMGVPTVIACW